MEYTSLEIKPSASNSQDRIGHAHSRKSFRLLNAVSGGRLDVGCRVEMAGKMGFTHRGLPYHAWAIRVRICRVLRLPGLPVFSELYPGSAAAPCYGNLAFMTDL